VTKPEDIDAILGLGRGAFDHIPKYCREEAIEAIAHVRRMEEQQLFRAGVYYVALTDLSGATASSVTLGAELNKRRVESFITACVESLGASEPKNYAHFLKAVGDAGLFLFSSFTDLYHWWEISQSRMQFYSSEWNRKIDPDKRSAFQLRSKTVFHVGEILYSDGNDPVSAAVNQIFKIEKMFTAGELGCTDIAKMVASPFFPDLKLSPENRGDIILPGMESATGTWLISKNELAQYDLA
jgi:hypothetical protein